MSTISYRTPGHRGWSAVPPGYSEADAILLLGTNYDLRIGGVIRPADATAQEQT